jgi:hypothetical protein
MNQARLLPQILYAYKVVLFEAALQGFGPQSGGPITSKA